VKSEKHKKLTDNRLSISIYQSICLLLAPFCLSAYLAAAEISQQQLDPADFLMPHLAKPLMDASTPRVTSKTLQDANTPNVPESPNAPLDAWEPTMLLDNLPSTPRKQSQTPDIEPVKHAHHSACRSDEAGKPSALSEPEGRESLLTSRLAPQALPRACRAVETKKQRQLPQDASTVTENQNSRVKRQLWRANITAPQDRQHNRSKNELRWIIEQIRAVKFEPQNRSPEPFIVVEPPTTEPNETLEEPHSTDSKTKKSPLEVSAAGLKTGTLADTEPTEGPSAKQIKSKPRIAPPTQPHMLQNDKPLPYVPVTSRTLQMLENLLQHPDQADKPFELAEVLFLSGHLKEASVFYREALNRERPDQPDPTEDRPWILFQIGNCLRHDDMPTALEMYSRLIAEYPNSPWTDLAKARHKLINWYRKDRPRTLIANPVLPQTEDRL